MHGIKNIKATQDPETRKTRAKTDLGGSGGGGVVEDCDGKIMAKISAIFKNCKSVLNHSAKRQFDVS